MAGISCQLLMLQKTFLGTMILNLCIMYREVTWFSISFSVHIRRNWGLLAGDYGPELWTFSCHGVVNIENWGACFGSEQNLNHALDFDFENQQVWLDFDLSLTPNKPPQHPNHHHKTPTHACKKKKTPFIFFFVWRGYRRLWCLDMTMALCTDFTRENEVTYMIGNKYVAYFEVHHRWVVFSGGFWRSKPFFFLAQNHININNKPQNQTRVCMAIQP